MYVSMCTDAHMMLVPVCELTVNLSVSYIDVQWNLFITNTIGAN